MTNREIVDAMIALARRIRWNEDLDEQRGANFGRSKESAGMHTALEALADAHPAEWVEAQRKLAQFEAAQAARAALVVRR